jgi:hypothetical protein
MDSVTLDTIGGGALSELFAAELGRILANIADPNTVAEQKRTITIAVSFKPTPDREVANVELTCSAKLAGIMKVSTRVFIGTQQGRLVAIESDPRQANMFDEARPPLAAVQFPKAGE